MPVQGSYGLAQPPAPAAPTPATSALPVEPPPPVAQKVGIVRPFRFGPDGNPVKGSGDALRASRLGRVFSTRSSGAKFGGELRWKMRFGSQMELLRQVNMDEAIVPLAFTYAQDGVARALPNEVVESAAVVEDDDAEELELTITTRDRRARGERAAALEVKVRP